MRDRVAAQDRDGLLDVLQPASAARRNLPARVARPDHLAELRIPVPDRAGVLAEITSLAADAGIGIYDIEIAHSAEGPRGVLILVVDGADAATLGAAVEAKGYRVPGGAPVVTSRAPQILVVDGGVPCRGTVRTPGEKSISHRSVLLAALAEGTSVVHGLSDGADVAASLAAVEAMGVAVERGDDGTGTASARRPEPAAPAGRPARLRQFGHLACGSWPASWPGFAWGTELVGDESLSTRPMDRVAEPLGQMGAAVEGHGERCLPPLRVRGGSLHGIDWTSKVASAQVKSAILLAGLSAEGDTVVREAVTTRTHTEEMLAEAGADIDVEPWGEGRVVTVRPSTLKPVERTVPGDPSAAAFFAVAGAVVPGSAVDVADVYGGPARLGFVERAGAHGRVTLVPPVAAATAPGRHGHHPGQPPGPLRATDVAPPRSPRSTRSPSSPWRRPSPRAPRCSSTWASSGSRRWTAWPPWPTWSRRSGPRPRIEGDTLAITGVGGPLHGARFDSRGDHRMAMAAAVAALAAAPGEQQPDHRLRRGGDQLPRLRRRPARLTSAGRRRRATARCSSPSTARPAPASPRSRRRVAEPLGVDRLDTGAMYRAVAALALERGIAPDDADGGGGARRKRRHRVRTGASVVIDGSDVTDVIRSPEVGQAVSIVAANPDVRAQLVRRQRDWAAAHGGGVVEGRDIGSVVFPDADLKVYLTASPEERARRRHDEAPEGVARRDRIDSTRHASPLRQADDAHHLDTTGRTVQDVVEEVLSWL